METLLTPRLRLRPLRLTDEDAMLRIHGDAVATRFLGGPTAPDENRAALARTIAFAEEHGYGQWAMERIADGVVIGHSGVKPMNCAPSELELLYALARDSWGFGFAREAAAAVLDHMFTVWGRDHIDALVAPDHVASCRVLEAIGMRVLADRCPYEPSMIHYRAVRPQT